MKTQTNQVDSKSNLDKFRAQSIAKQALNDADNDCQIYFEVYQNRMAGNLISGFKQIESHRVSNYDLNVSLGLQFCCQELPELSYQQSPKLLGAKND
jgi:hypothetical protein